MSTNKSIAITFCKDTNILWLWSWSYKHNGWTLVSKTTVECGIVADKTPDEIFNYYQHFDADIGEGGGIPNKYPYNYICIHDNATFTAGPNEDWVVDNSIRTKTINEIFGAKEYATI